jgi:hypothetical protein
MFAFFEVFFSAFPLCYLCDHLLNPVWLKRVRFFWRIIVRRAPIPCALRNLRLLMLKFSFGFAVSLRLRGFAPLR